MAETAQTEERVVIRCSNRDCHLNQYMTASGLCRKCRKPLIDAKPAPEKYLIHESLKPLPEHILNSTDIMDKFNLIVARNIRRERECAGLSQRDLSKLVRCPRSYISKIERARGGTTSFMAMRISLALDLEVGSILPYKEEIAELIEQAEVGVKA